MSNECAHYRQGLTAITSGARSAIPDGLALHLDACAACRLIFDAGRLELDSDAFETLSEADRRAIIETLAQARSARYGRRKRMAMAAAAAVFAVASVMAVLMTGGNDRDVARALVEDHIRYLRHPDRLGSPDATALAEELARHVDFPVRLPELPDARLTGGRQCYLLERRVALAFYDTATGGLSYFVLDRAGLSRPGRRCPGRAELRCALMQGYKVVTFEASGLLHAVVGPDTPALDDVAEEARRRARSPAD